MWTKLVHVCRQALQLGVNRCVERLDPPAHKLDYRSFAMQIEFARTAYRKLLARVPSTVAPASRPWMSSSQIVLLVVVFCGAFALFTAVFVYSMMRK